MGDKKKKRRVRCAYCKELKFDTRKRLDPCTLEIQGIEEYVLICDACEDQRFGDI